MYRTVSNKSGIEFSSEKTATLGANIVDVGTITPKQATGNIIGIQFIFSANISGTSVTGNVGTAINKITIKKGSRFLKTYTSIQQLIKEYHKYTGNTFSDVALVNGAGTLETPVIPLNFSLTSLVTIDVQANPYTMYTNGTGGTFGYSMRFVYSQIPVVDDITEITTTPTLLNSGIDINLGDYINVAQPIKEIWIDVSTDANLKYTEFRLGNSVIYGQTDAQTLINFEELEPQYGHIDGFFKLLIPRNTIINNAANSVAKLIINLNTSVAPTIYVFI